MAMAMAALAVPVKAIALVAAFPVGIGFMGSMVSTLALTQLLASAEYRGRLVAVWFVVLSGGVVVGSLITGALADLLGAGVTTALGAASLALIAVLVARRTAAQSQIDPTMSRSRAAKISPGRRSRGSR